MKHYFKVEGIADELEANDAPYAVGVRVKLKQGPRMPDIWVNVTALRCIVNDVKSANVHWDAKVAAA